MAVPAQAAGAYVVKEVLKGDLRSALWLPT